MRSVRDENILEHTGQVALFTHALCEIENTVFGGNVNVERAVLYALYHESSEVITGDLPTPVKYSNGAIESSFHALEDQAVERLSSLLPEALRNAFSSVMNPDKDSKEYLFMKCADKLSAYVKCLEELRSGNREFSKAKETIEAELNGKNIPALAYFMKEFIPEFQLTLDELNV